jgi:hypothetical protein|nr:MAG TPA: hypothetical protein [Bacteriophage sp.]
MENEFELKPFDKVLVRDDDNDVWQIDFFEKQEEPLYFEINYVCLMSTWKQCIPYEGNEHLLGTTDSPQEECQKEESGKQDEASNNYGYPVEYFKRNDIVLCRDNKDSYWRIDVFLYKNGSAPFPFRCNNSIWMECIPYEGNEHLMGTTDKPERCDTNKNTLFGIKIKPGYILELEYGKVGVIFPIREIGSTKKEKLALIYTSGSWVPFEYIEVSKVIAIRGRAFGSLLTNGGLLWKRAQKQSLTKAEIAERLGMRAKDFVIIDEDNE